MFYSEHPSLNEEDEEKEGVLNLRSNGNTFAACDAARKMRQMKTGVPYEKELTHQNCVLFCPFEVTEDSDISCFSGLLEKYCLAHSRGDLEVVSSLAREIAELEPRKEYENLTLDTP